MNSATVWEVWPVTGSDTNGGGFVAGASGTDYSQSATPHASGTAGTAVGTAAFSDVGYTFLSTHVGNLIQIASGSGFTAGFYYIVSVATGIATLNTSPGTGTAAVWSLGGALATITKCFTGFVTSNTCWVKATGTLIVTASQTSAASANGPGASIPYNKILGYGTTRGDGGQVTIHCTTNANINCFNFNIGTYVDQGWIVSNFIIDFVSGGGTTYGIICVYYLVVTNCKIIGASNAISLGGLYGIIQDCEITGTLGICILMSSGVVVRNYIHDNTCTGVHSGSPGALTVAWNIIANNSGGGSFGIQLQSEPLFVFNNIIYNSGSDGVNIQTADRIRSLSFRNNICVLNGGYGINGNSSAGMCALPQYDGNAYYGNTSGTRFGMDDTGSVNPVNGSSPYANPLDVILSADPFVNGVGGDFTLTTAGKLALQGLGSPGTIPGATPSGFLDIGALQTASGGGGGSTGILVNPGMTGGING